MRQYAWAEATVSSPTDPYVIVLKLLAPKTKCPFLAARYREERWPTLSNHVDQGRPRRTCTGSEIFGLHLEKTDVGYGGTRRMAVAMFEPCQRPSFPDDR